MNARMLWIGWVLLVMTACSGGGDKSNASSSATIDSVDGTSSTLADIDAQTSSTTADALTTGADTVGGCRFFRTDELPDDERSSQSDRPRCCGFP